ncbi:hypothetical protein GCM10022222_18760 [Amycolatopsis ultiminotia]|uniref:Thiopeptide-type bacteriocin biosynthesis domain-containing protein n=1 Tax=Amycolatopsis ultiminotia TaxID=543629 RepID=A0ABP6VK13_9PSEU
MIDTLLYPEWQYWRVYVSDLAEVTRLLDEVVRPALDRHRDAVRRWFYLQYMDLSGLQLRLRVRAEPAQGVADELERRFAERGAEVLPRRYEPELAKFRGRAGVELAEQIAHLGSETALKLLPGRASSRRVTQAAAHTSLVVAGLPAAQRVSFLHQYAWYWSGKGARTTVWRPPMAAARPDDPSAVTKATRLQDGVSRLLEVDEIGIPLRRYAGLFWRLYHESPRPVLPYRAAFQHIHLMNNRLGVVPGEEAQIARLLWLRHLP